MRQWFRRLMARRAGTPATEAASPSTGVAVPVETKFYRTRDTFDAASASLSPGHGRLVFPPGHTGNTELDPLTGREIPKQSE